MSVRTFLLSTSIAIIVFTNISCKNDSVKLGYEEVSSNLTNQLSLDSSDSFIFGVIVLSTFVSEDLTCIVTGIMAKEQKFPLWLGVVSCFVGIFVGDLGLYLLGRIARVFLFVPYFSGARLYADRLRNKMGSNFWRVLFASRFIPGTRFPVYVASGVIGGQWKTLVAVAALAGIVWTPGLVVFSYLVGGTLLSYLNSLTGYFWISLIVCIFALFVLLRVGFLSLTRRGRQRLAALYTKWTSLEFYPVWLFYAPLVPWIAYLTIRYRGFHTITASNPGIPDGGFIGESKAEILGMLPKRETLPWFVLDTETIVLGNHKFAQVAEGSVSKDRRRNEFKKNMKNLKWKFPVVMKPDIAQKGMGMKILRSMDDAERYLSKSSKRLIIQKYHPGPFEVGIFYIRNPNESVGRIFSITEKHFSFIEGNGVDTLEDLIWAHPRYRVQAKQFLERFENRKDVVLAKGERLQLAHAGNHFQGTLFRDGAHLMTPRLQDAIDRISKQIPGFFFGRFDIRYTKQAELKHGQNLAIVELNGATSESTNVYDPNKSIFFVYKTLFRQWRYLFEIGYQNRLNGHRATPLFSLLKSLWDFSKVKPETILSD